MVSANVRVCAKARFLLNFLIQGTRGSKICKFWKGLSNTKKVDPLWVQACSSVDLESVFPTHGVVGSIPTKPRYYALSYLFSQTNFLTKGGEG